VRFLSIILLLIITGLIGYVFLLQLDIFIYKEGSGGHRTEVRTPGGSTSQPETIFDTIDLAEDAARAME